MPVCVHTDTHTYISYCKSGSGSVDQTVTAAGLWGKTHETWLMDCADCGWWGPEKAAESCVWRMVPVLRGRKFSWPWISLEMTSGLLHLFRPQYSFRPGIVVFLLTPKPAQCFCHVQQHCRSHLLSEITLRFLSLFLQISNSTDSDCIPKVFVISSKVRAWTLPFSLCCTHRTCEVATAKLTKVVFVEVTLLWKFDRVRKEL